MGVALSYCDHYSVSFLSTFQHLRRWLSSYLFPKVTRNWSNLSTTGRFSYSRSSLRFYWPLRILVRFHHQIRSDQYGSRWGHSTTLQLTRVVPTFVDNLNNRLLSTAVTLDRCGTKTSFTSWLAVAPTDSLLPPFLGLCWDVYFLRGSLRRRCLLGSSIRLRSRQVEMLSCLMLHNQAVLLHLGTSLTRLSNRCGITSGPGLFERTLLNSTTGNAPGYCWRPSAGTLLI
ncbi:hypothetical protein J6590_091847 [Homalodisca vitripennis]|nr:hypothetical protein J6590_091847 [Homalodisca vitripennis]